MAQQPYRVISPHGIAWSQRFASEEGAWGRILYANGRLKDTIVNRTILENKGWHVRQSQPAVSRQD